MGYSNFRTIKTVIRRFNLDLQMHRLFGEVPPVAPSLWLQETLAETEFFPPTNEKAKSERIISPVLTEVARQWKGRISFFSGENIDMDPTQDLAGPCDFFFALQPPKPYIEAPIISIAEAKDEDMDWGIAQCAAQMYGASLFNQAEGKAIPMLYGAATDGIEWRFLRLQDNQFVLDTRVYTDLSEVLGVWQTIMRAYV